MPISAEGLGSGNLPGVASIAAGCTPLSGSADLAQLKSGSRSGARSAWLDALRATAVIAVVTFHVVQMSPLEGSAVSNITYYGQFGVDLFFVLSGWLIGTLFWREMSKFGRVSISRFWVRRALRTIPPYLVVLVLSWIGVAVVRKENFDFGYLIFIQNYYKTIPFFLVSWSLCIEEHFYLIIPLVAALLARFGGKGVLPYALVALVFLSPLARAVEFKPHLPEDLGYMLTATHLRLDGIAFGFLASFAAIRWPERFSAVARSLGLRVGVIVMLGIIVVIEIIREERCRYIFLPAALAMLFCLLVIARPMNATSAAAFGRLHWIGLRWIALRSYSAYLTHAIAIHLTLIITSRWIGASLLYWPIVSVTILAGTVGFYVLVESNAIKVRDAWVGH